MTAQSAIPVKATACTVAIFCLLAAMYFMPGGTLKGFLPEAAVKYRIAWPLLTLAIGGIFLLPRQMTLAMAFSFAGDFMGAYGSFMGQMGFFSLTHIMLICWFARNMYNPEGLRAFLPLLAASPLAGLAYAFIMPDVPAGIIRIGCGIYTLLICYMFGLSMLQRPMSFAAGAALFLFSDSVLAWDRFVQPLEHEKWLIMIPYYAGQLILYVSAIRQQSFQ